MKYVMVKCGDFYAPVVFRDLVSHADAAKAFLAGQDRRHSPGEIVSAGFYDLVNRKAHGSSASLEVSSRPEDSELVTAFLQGGDGLLQLVEFNLLADQNLLAAQKQREAAA